MAQCRLTAWQPKLRYLSTSFQKRLRGSGNDCPSCGSRRSRMLRRKYLVTALHRCAECALMFRTPTTNPEENARFYQTEYKQGFTTDLPDSEMLGRLKTTAFKGTEKDYASYIEVLSALGVERRSKVLDFGCSWGYGSWQLAEAGFRVVAHEISRSRRAYARDQLGVNVLDDVEEFPPDCDVFFSAHVLEHVSSVAAVLRAARRALRPGGLFVAFTPNGSAQFRAVRPDAWQHSWGLVHPNLLDEEFYLRAFFAEPLLLASTPYAWREFSKWAGERTRSVLSLRGDELACIVRLN